MVVKIGLAALVAGSFLVIGGLLTRSGRTCAVGTGCIVISAIALFVEAFSL